MPTPLLNRFIERMPEIRAAEAVQQVMIQMVADPQFDADFRSQWLHYWEAIAQGKTPPKVGAEEIVGSKGLLAWFARQGYTKNIVDERSAAEGAPENAPAEQEGQGERG